VASYQYSPSHSPLPLSFFLSLLFTQPNPLLFFSYFLFCSVFIHHRGKRKRMESTQTQTTSVWTDEKHLHFLNSMEASFVRTMLHHYAVLSSHPPLRLDRYLPDTSESTLDSKPNRRPKKHASAPPGFPHALHFLLLFNPTNNT